MSHPSLNDRYQWVGGFDCSGLVEWTKLSAEERGRRIVAARRRERRQRVVAWVRHPLVETRRRVVVWAWDRWGDD